MEEFAIFCVVVIAIALIVKFWPILVVAGLVFIFVRISMKCSERQEIKKAEEEREAEIRRAEEQLRLEAKRQYDEQKLKEIEHRISGLLNAQALEYRKIIDFYCTIEPEYRMRTIQQLKEYEPKLRKNVIAELSNGNLNMALCGMKLLQIIDPSEEYEKSIEVIQQLIPTSRELGYFMMSETDYGSPREERLASIAECTREECSADMQKFGLLYSLWFHSIKQRRCFDSNGFSVLLDWGFKSGVSLS